MCSYVGWASSHSCYAMAALKWKDILRILKFFDVEEPDESEESVSKMKMISERTWEQHKALKVVPKKLLKAVLEANGVYGVDRMKGDRVRRPGALHALKNVIMSPWCCFVLFCFVQITLAAADGMANGLLPPCPTCKNRSLVAELDSVRCVGWFSGATKFVLWFLPPPPPPPRPRAHSWLLMLQWGWRCRSDVTTTTMASLSESRGRFPLAPPRTSICATGLHQTEPLLQCPLLPRAPLPTQSRLPNPPNVKGAAEVALRLRLLLPLVLVELVLVLIERWKVKMKRTYRWAVSFLACTLPSSARPRRLEQN